MEEYEGTNSTEGVEEELEASEVPRTYWLPDWLYVALKWVVLVGLPAAGSFYAGLAGVWGWPLATEVTQTCSFVALFMGSLIGVSAAKGALSRRAR